MKTIKISIKTYYDCSDMLLDVHSFRLRIIRYIGNQFTELQISSYDGLHRKRFNFHRVYRVNYEDS
jgi:hypothetical protein